MDLGVIAYILIGIVIVALILFLPVLFLTLAIG